MLLSDSQVHLLLVKLGQEVKKCPNKSCPSLYNQIPVSAGTPVLKYALLKQSAIRGKIKERFPANIITCRKGYINARGNCSFYLQDFNFEGYQKLESCKTGGGNSKTKTKKDK